MQAGAGEKIAGLSGDSSILKDLPPLGIRAFSP